MAETVNFTPEQMAVVQQMIEAQTQKALASVGINEPQKAKEPPKKPLDTTTIYRAKDGRAVIVNKADAGTLLAEGDFTDKAPAAPKTGGK